MEQLDRKMSLAAVFRIDGTVQRGGHWLEKSYSNPDENESCYWFVHWVPTSESQTLDSTRSIYSHLGKQTGDVDVIRTPLLAIAESQFLQPCLRHLLFVYCRINLIIAIAWRCSSVCSQSCHSKLYLHFLTHKM